MINRRNLTRGIMSAILGIPLLRNKIHAEEVPDFPVPNYGWTLRVKAEDGKNTLVCDFPCDPMDHLDVVKDFAFNVLLSTTKKISFYSQWHRGGFIKMTWTEKTGWVSEFTRFISA